MKRLYIFEDTLFGMYLSDYFYLNFGDIKSFICMGDSKLILFFNIKGVPTLSSELLFIIIDCVFLIISKGAILKDYIYILIN